MREPSFSCTRWSSRSCSSIALYIFTGAFTSPNEMLPDQIARGMPSGYPLLSRRKTRSFRAVEAGKARGQPNEGGLMPTTAPVGSDVSAGTYKCTNCGYELSVQSVTSLPPCPNCQGPYGWET